MEKLIILSGSSGVGKGYIKDHIKRRWPFIKELPWYTTRSLREDEKLRLDRICINEDSFSKMKLEKRFLLTDSVGNYQYGLLSSHFQQRGLGITELRINLFNNLDLEKVFLIGIIPETIDFLVDRMNKRGNHSKKDIQERIIIAEDEIRMMLEKQDMFSMFISIGKNNENLIVEQILKSLNSFII